jgi:hypothetical protein
LRKHRADLLTSILLSIASNRFYKEQLQSSRVS